MNSELIVIKKLIDRLLRTWPVIIVSAILWSLLALFVVTLSPVFFESTVSVVVEEPYRMDDPQRWILGEQRFNEPERSHVVNEGVRIKEFSLVLRTVEELNLGVKYLEQGFLMDTEIYRQSPIHVQVADWGAKHLIPYEVAIYVKPLDGDRFLLSVSDEYGPDETAIELELEASYGEAIQLGGSTVRILRNDSNPIEEDVTYGFELVNTTELALDLAEDLDVESVELEASIFKVTLTEAPAGKANDILETLANLFVAEKLEERRGILRATRSTIEQQMSEIGQQLARQEGEIEQYKSSTEINSTEEQGRLLLEEISQLDNQLIELRARDKHMGYLEKGVDASGETRPSLVAPSAYGISDPALNQLVAEYNNLLITQATLVSENRTGHPAFDHTETQIEAKAQVIRETVKGFRLSNSILIENIQSQLSSLKKRSSSLPFEQMELLRKDRAFNALDLNYKALNQRKMEVEIAIASLAADVRVVEEAHDTSVDPKFPDPVLILIFLVLLTVMSPFIYLFVITLTGHSIKDHDELLPLIEHPQSQIYPMAITNLNGNASAQHQNGSTAIRDAKALLMDVLEQQQGQEAVIVSTLHWGHDRLAHQQVNLLSLPLKRMGVKTLIVRIHAGADASYSGYSEFLQSLRAGHEPNLAHSEHDALDTVASLDLSWSLEDRVSADDKALFQAFSSAFQLVIVQLPDMEINPDAAALSQLGSEALLLLRFGSSSAEAFRALQTGSFEVERQRIIVAQTPPAKLNLREAKNLFRYESLSLGKAMQMLFVRI